MKQLANYLVGAVLALGLSGAAWAQQRDLEVTINVVPASAQAGVAMGEIKLPESAAPEAHENAAFGLDTANKARARRQELDREFGREVSEAARERAQERIPNIDRPNIGRP